MLVGGIMKDKLEEFIGELVDYLVVLAFGIAVIWMLLLIFS
jgi:hypothetical protein